MARKAISSGAFPGVYLRLDGRGVTGFNGSGVVNCQFGAGPFETFEFVPQPDGTVSIGSTAFANVFLRLDGRGVTSFNGDGSGVVNGQFGAGPFEKFRMVAQDDGTTAFASAEFPNVYLRLDGRGVTGFKGEGAGTVNCQFGAGPFEKFYVVDIYESAAADGDFCAWFDSSYARTATAAITIPAHADLAFDKPFTVEAWIMWDGSPGRRPILSKPAGARPNEGFSLSLLDGAPAFDLPVTSAGATVWRRVVSPRKIAKSAWTHIAASFDGHVQRLYVNGFIAIEQDGTAGASSLAVATPLLIGRQYVDDADRQNGFFGLVWGVRFWNAVVPGNLIKPWSAMEDFSGHPMFANLMGYWRLDEASGSTYYDSSWRGHDGQGATGDTSVLQRIVYDQDAWWPEDRRFILSRDGGLALDAGAATAGTAVTLQIKVGFTNSAASRQLWRFEGGRIVHAASGLALDCATPEAVSLQPKAEGKATQAWLFDRQSGLVRSPGAPGLVLRIKGDAAPNDNWQRAIGSQLALAPDTPRVAGESEAPRRWLFLAARRRRPLVHAATNRVWAGDENLVDFDPAKDAHYWYDVAGLFINDGNGYAMTNDDGLHSPAAIVPLKNLTIGTPRNFIYTINHDGPDLVYITPGIGFSQIELAYYQSRVVGFVHRIAYTTPVSERRWLLGNTSGWTAVPGRFADLSVGVDGFVAVLTPEGVPLYFGGGGQWRRFPSPPADAAEISVGTGAAVWLRVRSGKIFRFNGTATNTWEEVPGRLFAQIDATATGSAWGIDTDGKIVRRKNDAWEEVTTSWQQSRGHLSQVSAGTDGLVWGVNPSSEIWTYQPRTEDWRLVPGSLRSISVGGDGSVWGVNTGSGIFRYQGSAANNWDGIGGRMKVCSVGNGGMVWALNATGEPYRYGAA